MNILLVGASGRTGRHVIHTALARHHQVTALARSPGSIPSGEGLSVLIGDPRDPNCISNAVKSGADVVISCLGQRTSEDRGLLTAAAAATVRGLSGSPSVPYIVLSQGLLFQSRNPVIAILRLFLRRHVEDSEGMERILANSNIAWEIVRPPRLRDSKHRSSGYSIEIGAMPRGAASMERSDLALYLVEESETRAHL
jgi:putative NADH-flavin reductase